MGHIDPPNQTKADPTTGKCNVTYFKQAEKMKKAGKASSDRDAAKKIAKDSGEPETAVRKRIQRGREKVAQGGPPNLTKQDQTFILNQAKQIKTERRKERIKKREKQKEEVIQGAPPLQGKQYELILGEFQTTEMGYAAKEAALVDGQIMAGLLLEAEGRLGEILKVSVGRGGKSSRSSRGGTSKPLPPF